MDIIPPKLSHLLHGITDEISASVGSALSSIEPLLLKNNATFFPDYTDHGLTHVKSVLRTCELLVNEVAWNQFTREDAAALIIATVTHDLGMLVDVDGLSFILDNKQENESNYDFNDKPWAKLWQEFQMEVQVSRFAAVDR